MLGKINSPSHTKSWCTKRKQLSFLKNEKRVWVSHGFTLFETLVVMALMSILMLGMVSALRGVGQGSDRVDARLYPRLLLERGEARELERAARMAGGKPTEDGDDQYA